MYKKTLPVFMLLIFFGCQKISTPTSFTENEKLGQKIYQVNCLSCHHPNPMQTGTIGPDLANSSFELIKMRVTSLDYPKNYRPKRRTHLMPEFKHLTQEDIQYLYDYINAFQKINYEKH